MFVLAVASQKGGSGKSTMVTALASALLRAKGPPVRIIDADPQRTAATWFQQAKDDRELGGLELLEWPKADLHRRELGSGIVLIDCPGRVDAVLLSALIAADALLVPLQPTYADAWALPHLATQVEAAARRRERPLRAGVVLNRVRRGTTLFAEASKLAGALPAGFQLLKTAVRDLVDFQMALGCGMTPLELRPRGNAAEDIRSLTKELTTFLRGVHVEQGKAKSAAAAQARPAF